MIVVSDRATVVIRQNWTITEAGMATAVANAKSDRMIGSRSGANCSSQINPYRADRHPQHSDADGEKCQIVPGNHRQDSGLCDLEYQQGKGDEKNAQKKIAFAHDGRCSTCHLTLINTAERAGKSLESCGNLATIRWRRGKGSR